MWRALASALIFVFLAAAGEAVDRPQGLLWNRSGLPATLPLQVRTDPGADYLLRLRDLGTGRAVLAAYIRGGQFFRVLVPPGRYQLLFASGTDWQGEAALFGPDTKTFVLDPPLSFGATLSRKEGHVVDLRAGSGAAVRDLAICQWLMLDPQSLLPPPPVGASPTQDGTPTPPPPEYLEPYPTPRYDLLWGYCD
jgi:hypothetical protein